MQDSIIKKRKKKNSRFLFPSDLSVRVFQKLFCESRQAQSVYMQYSFLNLLLNVQEL